MALRLSELLVDDVAAMAMQLMIEYDPSPVRRRRRRKGRATGGRAGHRVRGARTDEGGPGRRSVRRRRGRRVARVRCADARRRVELRVVSSRSARPSGRRTAPSRTRWPCWPRSARRHRGLRRGGHGAAPLYREETVEGVLILLRQALVPWILGHEITHPEVLTGAARLAGEPHGQGHASTHLGLLRPPAGPAAVEGPRRRRRRGARGRQFGDGSGPRDGRARRPPSGPRATSGSS